MHRSRGPADRRPDGPDIAQPGPRDTALRHARVCYNHLAGNMGVRLYQRLVDRDLLRIDGDALSLNPAGQIVMSDFGIDLNTLNRAKAPLCRPCLDWSERRTHLAGSLGRAVMSRIEHLGWPKRRGDSRVVLFSTDGQIAFDRWLGPS